MFKTLRGLAVSQDTLTSGPMALPEVINPGLKR